MVDEDEDQEVREPETPKSRREIDVRNQRRQELEARIGMTKSGHEWLSRIDRIGKDAPQQGE